MVPAGSSQLCVKPQGRCLVAVHVAWSLPRSGVMWGPVGQNADIKAHPLPSVQAAPLWGALPYLPPHLESAQGQNLPDPPWPMWTEGPAAKSLATYPSPRGRPSQTSHLTGDPSLGPQGPPDIPQPPRALGPVCVRGGRVTPPSCPQSSPAAWDPHGPKALPLRTGSWAIKMGIQGVDTRNLKRMARLEKRCGRKCSREP